MFDESMRFFHVCKFRKLDLFGVWASVLFLPRNNPRTRAANSAGTRTSRKRVATVKFAHRASIVRDLILEEVTEDSAFFIFD